MGQRISLLLVLGIGLAIGYFGGREHLKYEMRSAIRNATEQFSSAFQSDSKPPSASARIAASAREDGGAAEAKAEADYIDASLALYDLSAKYIETYSGTKPGVLFKLRNDGQQTLDRVEVTVYFKDATGAVIAEEDFNPVLVTKYTTSDGKPLRPGYIWQMESGKFYTAKNVPSEWQEGSIEAAITNVRFAEASK
ncbi:MAG: hypothetical protein AAFQ99_08255 [Pseudomonadota bacterium]